VRHHPIADGVPAFPSHHGRRQRGGQQALAANPSNRLLRGRFRPANLDGLGHARIDVGGLHESEETPFEPSRPMRRQILEPHAGVLELAHERRVLHERRDDDDVRRQSRIEQSIDQPGAQHVPCGSPVRNRDEHQWGHQGHA
jgi:hypothetical protein